MWLQLTAQRIRLQTWERKQRGRRNSLSSFRDTDCHSVSSELRFARRGDRFLESPFSIVLYRVSFRFRCRSSICLDIYRKKSHIFLMYLYIIQQSHDRKNKFRNHRKILFDVLFLLILIFFFIIIFLEAFIQNLKKKS